MPQGQATRNVQPLCRAFVQSLCAGMRWMSGPFYSQLIELAIWIS